MTNEGLIIVCPQCGTLNRMPRERRAAGGRCGECRAELFDGHPAALDGARFARFLDKSDVPVLVDLWAPWCGPCRMMAPEFERAARELEPRLKLVKVNIDEEPEVARRFGVQSIPTILLVLHGRELGRIVGARAASDLVRWAEDRIAR
ncbi:MAG TPA: thioredoxin TrxC [Stellaceae bacterium]|nr:thioredoxin TrxC [Stellaceae bacterium]